MRVTGGIARGKKIKTKKGPSTRPLLSRVRKSLFDVLGDAIEEKKFLDLYAGSGAVGIEALSRGASEATFVEIDVECVRIIRENLFHCGFLSKAKIYQKDVLQTLLFLLERENFPFIFIGPPYFKDLQNKTLDVIQELNPYQAQIIVQHSPQEKINLKRQRFEPITQKKYGDTYLSFLFKKNKSE
ncbi:16S rRNA (guanine(966)-N(2))-methyltransferase RsmD [Candidatus Aerophobetes bacterium]|nr:16S rRNA (guanine(966)-N(2))-methyltransferase RsmD [Candidatus Aerophobetes bacterium]